jgi:probable HAF family extracellular repeat protein
MRRWSAIITIIGIAAILTACPKPKVEAITVTPDTTTLAIGETVALVARVHPPSARQGVNWASEAPSVASVSDEGLVTGKSTGAAMITATSVARPNVMASASITVVASPGTESPTYAAAAGDGLRHAPWATGEVMELTVLDDDGAAHTLPVEVVAGLVVFGGDMILGTETELLDVVGTGGTLAGPRSVVIRDPYFWNRRGHWPDSVVRFSLEDDWDDPNTSLSENAVMRNAILDAMDAISLVSGVRFLECSDGDCGSEAHMHFRNNPDRGCSAWVGHRAGHSTNVNLAWRCRSVDVVIHEIMHGLGFEHEHQRPDRDDRVEILEDNIQAENLHNFTILSASRTTMIGDYDHHSLMHYHENAFCIRIGPNANDPCDAAHTPTIRSIETPPQAFGAGANLTQGDVDGLIEVYGPPLTVSVSAPPDLHRIDVTDGHAVSFEAVVEPSRHPGVAVTWTSQLQGHLGAGSAVELAHRDLVVGVHWITVEAVDTSWHRPIAATDAIRLHVTKPAPEVRLQAPPEPHCVGVPITLWANVTDAYYLPYPFPPEGVSWQVGAPSRQLTGNPVDVQFDAEGVVPVRVRATDPYGQYDEDTIDLHVRHCVIAEDDSVSVFTLRGDDRVTVIVDVLANDRSTAGRTLFISDVGDPNSGTAERVDVEGLGRQAIKYSGRVGLLGDWFTYEASDGVASGSAGVRIDRDMSHVRVEPVLEWPGPAVACDLVPDWAWPDACCVNDRGDVALAVLRGFEHWQAHIALHDGTLVDIGTLGGDESRPFGLNDRGWVVGVSGTTDGGDRAFLWTPEDGIRDLGTADGPNSLAMAVSNDGHVVGATELDGSARAVLWTRDGRHVDLGAVFQSGSSFATGVVDTLRSGPVVVGTYFPPPIGSMDSTTPIPHPMAFRWYDANGDGLPQLEEFTWLGDLGGGASMATGINAALEVVGHSALPTREMRGFLWSDGEMSGLDAPDARATAAMGINLHGQVVGSIERGNGSVAGAIWDAGELVETGDLLPAEWSLRRLRDVNDHGILLGEGVDLDRCLRPIRIGPDWRFSP